MKEPPPATNFNFSSFAALLLCAALLSPAFCSCSEDPVKISATQAHFILDWQENDGFPEQRLSVFVELASNVRRVEYLCVKYGDYVWTVESPVLLESGGRQWAGSPRLEPPPGANGTKGAFAPGDYIVECVDSAGEKTEGTFFVAYDKTLLEADVQGLLEKLPATRERYAVYSDSNELLYFDMANDRWYDDDAIFKDVKDSSFYRKALLSGNVVCFMPKIFKDGEKPDGLE